MSKEEAVILGAIIGGLSGLFVAVISAIFTKKIAERKRADDLLSVALEYMGGGRQRRNLGIAAISLYWRFFPQNIQLCAEMLIGSAIYLLTESEGKDKAHEKYNLLRIMYLLNEMKGRVDNLESYKTLLKQLDNRIVNYEPEPKRGLWVSEDELKSWKSNIQIDP
jgi:hypothetical protein